MQAPLAGSNRTAVGRQKTVVVPSPPLGEPAGDRFIPNAAEASTAQKLEGRRHHGLSSLGWEQENWITPMADVALQLEALINDLREGLQVEVKNWLNGLNQAADKARLAKEIIALANSGGGFIFIGFEDEEPHAPIEPTEEERRGFTQDSIAGLVHAYLSPPCQCELHFVRQENGAIAHPVLVVPGEHRTPVFALRGGPENGILDNGKVYVRRPGGNSEHARTQDDWERLLERLVKARQSSQLNAIREIINPSRALDAPLDRNAELETWTEENLTRWQERIAHLDPNDPRRFQSGYWYTSYLIEPFEPPSLVELREQFDRQMPKYSGWPPFTFLHRDDRRPQPHGETIEAWMGEGDDGWHSDFWRVARDGRAFLLRPMQEDRPDYGSSVIPGPPRPTFDWVLPIYRVAELLKQLEAFASINGGGESNFDLILKYEGTAGRTLWRTDEHYWLDEHGPSNMEALSSQISANVAELEFNLNEIVWKLLQPIYAQFNFAELPKELVDRVVNQVNDFRLNFGR